MTLALSQITLREAEVEANLKQLETWTRDFDTLMGRLAPRFKRAELRERVNEYVQGLLSSAERKNSWQIAEQLGKSTPWGMRSNGTETPVKAEMLYWQPFQKALLSLSKTYQLVSSLIGTEILNDISGVSGS